MELEERPELGSVKIANEVVAVIACLLYTSDAADDLLCVDLGGRRSIKKNIQSNHQIRTIQTESSNYTMTRNDKHNINPTDTLSDHSIY